MTGMRSLIGATSSLAVHCLVRLAADPFAASARCPSSIWTQIWTQTRCERVVQATTRRHHRKPIAAGSLTYWDEVRRRGTSLPALANRRIEQLGRPSTGEPRMCGQLKWRGRRKSITLVVDIGSVRETGPEFQEWWISNLRVELRPL
jgi:hypothetical protein